MKKIKHKRNVFKLVSMLNCRSRSKVKGRIRSAHNNNRVFSYFYTDLLTRTRKSSSNLYKWSVPSRIRGGL